MADHYDVALDTIPTFAANDPLVGALWPKQWMHMVRNKLQQKMQDPKANQFMGLLIDLFNQAKPVSKVKSHIKPCCFYVINVPFSDL